MSTPRTGTRPAAEKEGRETAFSKLFLSNRITDKEIKVYRCVRKIWREALIGPKNKKNKKTEIQILGKPE